MAVVMAASIALRARSAAPMPAPPHAAAAPTAASQTTHTPPPAAPVQPVPYSHKTHIALGFECRQCHVNPEAGRLMTYPPATLCMSCHQAVAADRPSIQKLAALAASGNPIPWVRVYAVPDYVFWSHGPHLAAKVSCVECHGPVPERDVIAQETDVVTMLGCRRCHDQRQVFTDCGDCHEPRQ
jgi:hypothetical protein